MSTQHEALELASDIDEKRLFSCSQTAKVIRQQHALIVLMAEALKHSRQVLNHHNLPLECGPVNVAILAAKDYLK